MCVYFCVYLCEYVFVVCVFVYVRTCGVCMCMCMWWKQVFGVILSTVPQVVATSWFIDPCQYVYAISLIPGAILPTYIPMMDTAADPEIF